MPIKNGVNNPNGNAKLFYFEDYDISYLFGNSKTDITQCIDFKMTKIYENRLRCISSYLREYESRYHVN